MEIFGTVLQKTLAIFKIELTLWGYTFSMWEIFAFVIVVGVVCWIIGEWLLGD